MFFLFKVYQIMSINKVILPFSLRYDHGNLRMFEKFFLLFRTSFLLFYSVTSLYGLLVFYPQHFKAVIALRCSSLILTLLYI